MSSSNNHYIELTLIFEKEDDGRWTAECQELGTAIYSYSFEKAQEEIIEAIDLHLEGLCEVGELKRFFDENNIKIKEKPSRQKIIKATKRPNAYYNAFDYKVNQGAMACL